MSEEEKARIVHAGTVSYEEVNGGKSSQPAKPTATPPETLVKMAIDRIAKCTDPDVVEKIRLDAQGSDKINPDQKKKIAEAALSRLEQITIK